jgi:hypothetical protein
MTRQDLIHIKRAEQHALGHHKGWGDARTMIHHFDPRCGPSPQDGKGDYAAGYLAGWNAGWQAAHDEYKARHKQ